LRFAQSSTLPSRLRIDSLIFVSHRAYPDREAIGSQ
jgi:hypothetical protein